MKQSDLEEKERLLSQLIVDHARLFADFLSDLEIDNEEQRMLDAILAKIERLKSLIAAARERFAREASEWVSRQKEYTEARVRFRQLNAWGHGDARILGPMFFETDAAAESGDFCQALASLDQLFVSLEPVYEDFLLQRDAETRFRTRRDDIGQRFEAIAGLDAGSEERSQASELVGDRLESIDLLAMANRFSDAIRALSDAEAELQKAERMAGDSWTKSGGGSANNPATKTAVDPDGGGSIYGGTSPSVLVRGTIEWDKAQKEAGGKYKAALKEFKQHLDALRSTERPSAPILNKISSLDYDLGNVSHHAHTGDFATGLRALAALERDLSTLKGLISSRDRQTWLFDSTERFKEIGQLLPKALPKFADRYKALSSDWFGMADIADSGDYAAALALSSELDSRIVELRADIDFDDNHDQIIAELRSLEPRLSLAKVGQPGEAGFESLLPLRKAIAEHEQEVMRLAKAANFDDARKMIGHIAGEIDEIEAVIAEKEATPFEASEMPAGPMSFDAVAQQYGVEPAVLWWANPELHKKYKDPSEVETGTPIKVPDKELKIEVYQHEGKILLLSEKERIKLEIALAAEMGREDEATLIRDYHSYENWYYETQDYIGCVAGQFARIVGGCSSSGPSDQLVAAYRTVGNLRRAVASKDYKAVLTAHDDLEKAVRTFGSALVKWRDCLFDKGGRRGAWVLTKVRNSAFTLAGTLASGGISGALKLGFGGSMIVNGLTNGGAGVVMKSFDLYTRSEMGDEIDLGDSMANLGKGFVFDTLVGSAAYFVPSFMNYAKGTWRKPIEAELRNIVSSATMKESALSIADTWITDLIMRGYVTSSWQQYSEPMLKVASEELAERRIGPEEFGTELGKLMQARFPQFYSALLQECMETSEMQEVLLSEKRDAE